MTGNPGSYDMSNVMRGRDPEEIFKEFAEDLARMEKLGLLLDQSQLRLRPARRCSSPLLPIAAILRLLFRSRGRGPDA